MMLRRLITGLWRRRRVDDQDDVATVAAEESHGTGHGRSWPESAPDHPPGYAAWLAAVRRRREEEEIALLLATLVAADD